MASETIHIEKANRNQQFLVSLITAPHPYSDWIAVAAFYKAVHVVEAVFARNQPLAAQHSVDHTSRNRILKTSYPEIWSHYFFLYKTSLIARYLEFSHGGAPQQYASFQSYMIHHQVVTQLLEIDLVGVETESIPYLSGVPPLAAYPAPVKPATPASGGFTLPPTGAPPSSPPKP
jgi:hypothetical protein